MSEQSGGWTSPSALLTIVGILMVIIGGYLATQGSNVEAIHRLEGRVGVLESQVADLRENQRELMSERRDRERRER